MQKVAFGGGCFWCTEAVFKMLKGVSKVLPGYAGGKADDATYERVSTGTTGHAEVAYIEYDPAEVKFRDLLTIFFASHDATTVNQQGPDIGPQYRSIIFYADEEQKSEAEKFIAKLDASSPAGGPVVTELAPLTQFYAAEDYHKNYFATHPDQTYCQVIISPKLQKVQKQFGELMRKLS